jgi:hypothetical protein
MVWSTLTLLLVDTAVLQVIAALFAIGLAALIAAISAGLPAGQRSSAWKL